MTGLTDDRRIKISNFLPVLNGLIPGVTSPVARLQLVAALTEFCGDSSYWREQLGDLRPDGTDRVHDLEMPQDTVFAGYICCRLLGEKLDADLYEITSPSSMRFDASVVGAVTVEAAVKPTPGVSLVPESIYAHYSEAVCHGAAARLFAMPGSAWHDPSKVGWHVSLFREGISRARRDVQEGYKTEQTHTRLRRGGQYF
ncbi:hypothetical protein [Marinobacterium iners]|uniref:Uncharacterized protein n=1 Tax=Marinobacterium iners DSM 11526 TaxID=1122198 RepID=A0A1H3X6J2_9GAMM|nr:hypothetical protein [Marinobacterium iners]SDZ94571.1 hypothetical protein SAMN02745729_10145 [Marinobacterium iners DSM 11526]